MIAALWRRLTLGTRRVWHAPDWPEYVGLDWCDKIMGVSVTDRFHAKQGRSIGRWTLAAGERQLVVYLKRHHRLPRWAGLLAALFPVRSWSPGAQEWHHLQWAKKQGLPVPRAVAAGELAGPWGRLQSFLAIEELTGMLPLHEAIPLAANRLPPTAFARWKRGLIVEMARIARALHDRNWYHKDLYLCHFYIAEAETRRVQGDWAGRVYLIDLHRLNHHPLTSAFFRAKDLAQLLYSSAVSGICDRDRAYFWRCYRSGRTLAWLRRMVLFKARRYRRHNENRDV
jgi:hypothetical protein